MGVRVAPGLVHSLFPYGQVPLCRHMSTMLYLSPGSLLRTLSKRVPLVASREEMGPLPHTVSTGHCLQTFGPFLHIQGSWS